MKLILHNSSIQNRYSSIQRYIPVLMASTGSKREAEIAGKIPEINPIIAAKPVPRQTLKKLSTNSNSNKLVNPRAMSQTIKIPMKPPITHNIIASNKN